MDFKLFLNRILRTVISISFALSPVVSHSDTTNVRVQSLSNVSKDGVDAEILSPGEDLEIEDIVRSYDFEQTEDQMLLEMERVAVRLNDLEVGENDQVLDDFVKHSVNMSDNKIYNIRKLVQLKVRVLTLGFRKKLVTRLQEVANRLTKREDGHFEIWLVSGKYPVISYNPHKKKLFLNLGAIGYSRSWDDVAAFLAMGLERAVTHDSLTMNNNSVKKRKINELVDSQDLNPTQIRNLKSDLKAVDRLIYAGYNPNSIYEIFKRLSKVEVTPWEYRLSKWIFGQWDRYSDEFLASEPFYAIKTAAVKTYLIWLQEEQDLFDVMTNREKFSGALKIVRNRLFIYQLSETSFWYRRLAGPIKRTLQLLSVYMVYEFGKMMLVSGPMFTVQKTANSVLQKVGMEPISNKSVVRQVDKMANEAVYQSLRERLDSHLPPWAMNTVDKIRDKTSFIGDAFFEVKYFISEHAYNTYLFLGMDNLSMEQVFSGFIATSVVSFFGLTGYGLYTSYKQEHAKDPLLNSSRIRIRSSMGSLRSILRSIKNNSSESRQDIIFKAFSVNVKYAKWIERFYRENGIFREFRLFNGILSSRIRTTFSLIDIMKKFTKANRSFSIDKKFVLRILKELEGAPFYLYESKSFRRNLMKMIQDNEIGSMDLAQPMKDLIREQSTKMPNAVRKAMIFNRAFSRDALTGEDYYLLFVYFAENKAFDSARKIFNSNHIAIYDFLQTTDNTYKSEIEDFIVHLNRVNRERTLKPIGLFRKLLTEFKMRDTVFRGQTNSERKGLAASSISTQVDLPRPRFLSLRSYQLNIARNNLKEEILPSLEDFSAITDYFDRLVNLNTYTDSYAMTLHEEVKNRDEENFLSSEAEVNSFIERDYYWPMLGVSISEAHPAESILLEYIFLLREKYPEAWKYKPSSTQSNHLIILKWFEKNPSAIESYDQKLAWWKKLVTRGVSTVSDDLFSKLYSEASSDQQTEVEDYALSKGLIFEPRLKAVIAKTAMSRKGLIEKILLMEKDNREKEIREYISFLLTYLPEKGVYFDLALEDFSVAILSTEKESSLISRAGKTNIESNEQVEDFSLRVLSSVISEVLNWRKSNQFKFLMYLIGEEKASPKVEQVFSSVGPERVKKLFQELPLRQKAGVLDMILDNSNGLMPHGKFSKGYGKVLIDFLLQGKDDTTIEESKKYLNAFFHSLEAVGNKSMGTYLVSYILSMPRSQNQSAAHVLLNISNEVGLTFTKLVQLIAALEKFSDEENQVLRKAQDGASPMIREDKYQNFREIFGAMGIPFELGVPLGSASVKVADEIKKVGSDKLYVSKLFRKSAFTKARQQFRILREMATYMTKKYGPRYAVVKALVEASIAAVEKELNAHDEVLKGHYAREEVYGGLEGSSLNVPYDVWITHRMIISEFMPGTSLKPENLTEQTMMEASKKVLEAETEILYGEGKLINNKRYILFDPDRHSGNNRVVEEDGAFKDQSVIDVGQLTVMSIKERERFFEIFAISQVLRETTIGTRVAIDMLKDLFSDHDLNLRDLKKYIDINFASGSSSEIDAFFALTASLHESGVAMKPEWEAFLRAHLQLQPYEKRLSSEFESIKPNVILADRVTEKAITIGDRVRDNLTNAEKARIGINRVRNGQSLGSASETEEQSGQCRQILLGI